LNVALISYAEVSTTNVVIKFAHSAKASSITNDKFTVATSEATPVVLTNPFRTINIIDDYDSISRILVLYWIESKLSSNTSYTITISGLLGAGSTALPSEVISFTTGDIVAIDSTQLPPPAPAITIEDHSIVSNAFTQLLISNENRPFSVDSIDPLNGDYYLPANYNNGRILIKFTQRPAYNFLAYPYIKVQKKKLQRTPSRWEDIEFNISIDSVKPWLYIDLPSTDHYPELATPHSDSPVYYVDDFRYFEENYKYRVLLSRELST